MMSSNFLAVFKEILLENAQEETEDFDSYLTRNIQIPLIPKKAMIFTGVRRSGKSTLMRQVQRELKAKTLKPFHSIHVHFFDERLSGCTAKDLNALLEAFYEIYPSVSPKDDLYLFLDEIEVIENWELFVDRQLRIPHRKVFITGSSSRLLSKEIATAMRGRSLSFEIFPFSFNEIIQWEKLASSLIRTEQAKIRARFQTYLREGGFPEVIHQTPFVQKKILQEYYEVLLLKDILERNREGNIPLVRGFNKLLLQSFSSLITLNKSHERLKSLGIKADKSKLTEILEWVEDCYFLFPVSIFSESVSKQNTNPKKIYAIDNGLIRALTTQTSDNSGRLLENAVFLHLRSKNTEIHYYKTRQGYEIDFIVGNQLIQVADSIVEEDTFQREVRALEHGMEELGVTESYLIYQNPIHLKHPSPLQCRTGNIHLIEVTQWLTSTR